jgi:hypothetical protein
MERMNNRKAVSVFMAMLAMTAACKKSPASAPTQAPETVLSMPEHRSEAASAAAASKKDAEFQHALEKRYPNDRVKQEEMRKADLELNALLDAEDKLAEINRRAMVTPPPAGFKPESVARKVRLKLFIEKSNIKIGESPRYRLEMTNVGQEAIEYSESYSSLFVEGASLWDSMTMHFYLTDARGKRFELTAPTMGSSSVPDRRPISDASDAPDGPPEGLSEADKEKWFRKTNAMGQAHARFKVTLFPGETLHSLGDGSVRDGYRDLITDDAHFDVPGKYRLSLKFDDRPEPLDEENIRFAVKYSTRGKIVEDHSRRMKTALGPISTPEVAVEVHR